MASVRNVIGQVLTLEQLIILIIDTMFLVVNDVDCLSN